MGEAHRARDDAKGQLGQRIDPAETRKPEKIGIACAAENPFRLIAAEWLHKISREDRALAATPRPQVELSAERSNDQLDGIPGSRSPGEAGELSVAPDKVFGLEFAATGRRNYFCLAADRSTMPITR